jgi:methylmalonyl-CoA/ethylmalonyl-CoA epimerase
MKVLRLHHVGVIVADPRAVISALELLGMPSEHMESYANELDISFHGCGNALVEVITPCDVEGWNAQWLARTGPSVQHIAFEVADIDQAISELHERNIPVMQPAPRPGAGGTTIAFIDPVASGSILLELVYDPARISTGDSESSH